jgi:hypothetical protein
MLNNTDNINSINEVKNEEVEVVQFKKYDYYEEGYAICGCGSGGFTYCKRDNY